MNIIENIESKITSITKKQRIICTYIKNNIETMTFSTLKELSVAIGVTENTILSTCQALGYSNFNELKYECRKYISLNHRIEIHQEKEYFNAGLPKYELGDNEKLIREVCKDELAIIQELINNISEKRLLEIVEVIFKYKKIIICGRGISYILGEFLSLRLTSVECGSTLINTELNDSVYSVIPMIDRDTLLIAISFPDYYFMTDKIAEYAKKNHAEVLAITNSEEANIKMYSDHLLLVPSYSRVFMNTLTAPMAMINILASALEIVKKNKTNENDNKIGFESLFLGN